MPEKTFRQAINEALHHEMAHDGRVILMGEDVAGGSGANGDKDAWGGAFGCSKGLLGAFGPARVRDTPITESAFVGAAGGAALTGLRPVVEVMYVDFVGVCLDQIMNQMAKFRYMFGGSAETPVVIRASYGAGRGGGSQHSQALYPIFTHIPGLKVVIPSSPYEAKGLLIQSIRDNDPVVFLESKMLYATTGEVPDGGYVIPLGEANVLREGGNVLLIAIGRMVGMAMEAAKVLAEDGIACTVVDPRTTSPLDEDTILELADGIGRVVIVDEAYPRCGMAADISSIIAEKAFTSLQSPILKVTPPHTPVPYAPVLEHSFVPSVDRIIAAARKAMETGSA